MVAEAKQKLHLDLRSPDYATAKQLCFVLPKHYHAFEVGKHGPDNSRQQSFQHDPCQKKKNQTLDHAKTQNAPHLHAACIGLLLTVITSYTLQKAQLTGSTPHAKSSHPSVVQLLDFQKLRHSYRREIYWNYVLTSFRPPFESSQMISFGV